MLESLGHLEKPLSTRSPLLGNQSPLTPGKPSKSAKKILAKPHISAIEQRRFRGLNQIRDETNSTFTLVLTCAQQCTRVLLSIYIYDCQVFCVLSYITYHMLQVVLICIYIGLSELFHFCIH